MPYVTFNISDKIEMNGFDTEEEARAYCRKAYYPYFILFEGTFDDAFNDRPMRPVAIYVNGQGYNCTKVEKDVPYTTYRVIPDKLPRAESFRAIITTNKTYYEVHDEIDAAFEQGARLVWVIHEDMRFVDVHTAVDRKSFRMVREQDTLDGGDVAPGYSVKAGDLFEEVIVE